MALESTKMVYFNEGEAFRNAVKEVLDMVQRFMERLGEDEGCAAEIDGHED
ncbi:hypothetical protein QQ045_001790 [Rhodiola kirilowii]